MVPGRLWHGDKAAFFCFFFFFLDCVPFLVPALPLLGVGMAAESPLPMTTSMLYMMVPYACKCCRDAEYAIVHVPMVFAGTTLSHSVTHL